MGQFCETLQHLLWIMESPLILEWLHFSLSFQKRRKASKKPDNSVSPYKHFEDNSQMTTVSELYRASANENGQMGQMGSQLGTCSTRGTGKETASGESCRGHSLLGAPPPIPSCFSIFIFPAQCFPSQQEQHRPGRAAWTSLAAAFLRASPLLTQSWECLR